MDINKPGFSAILSAVVAVSVALIAGIFGFMPKYLELRQQSERALSVSEEALQLASGAGECRSGDHLPQFFLEHPLELGSGGSVSLTSAETSRRELPQGVPETAKYIKIIATVKTGNAHSDGASEGFIRVSSLPAHGSKYCSFYLYIFPSVLSGYAYNSDSEWIPVPADRKVDIQLISQPFAPSVVPLSIEASATARVFVLAYR